MITGIHQCGDLSSSSVKEFAHNKSVSHLCIVGCCYNRLTEKIDKPYLLEHSVPFKRYFDSLGLDKCGRFLDDTLQESGEAGFPLS